MTAALAAAFAAAVASAVAVAAGSGSGSGSGGDDSLNEFDISQWPEDPDAGGERDVPRAGGKSGAEAGSAFVVLILGAYCLYWAYLSLGAPLGIVVNGLMDDSFYYLQVARNLASGLGSTFDGVEPTNGYHPLWMILLVPVYWIFSGDDAPLRAALVMASLLGLGFLLWVRSTLAQTVGSWAAATGLLIFAWPRFFGQTVNLLETSLLLFLYLTAIGCWVRWSRSPGKGADPDSKARVNPRVARNRSLLFGALLGLACLARLDTIFLLLALGAVSLLGWVRREPIWPWQDVRNRSLMIHFFPLGVAGLLVLPYLFWNQVQFGHLQPVSGSMKSTFPDPGFTVRYLREFPEFAVLCGIGLAYFVLSLKRGASPLVRILGGFGLAGLLHMAYTLIFMCWGVDRWHFGILIPLAVLGIPFAAERVLLRSGFGGTLFRRTLLIAGLTGAVLLQGFSFQLRDGRYLDVTRHLAYWARTGLPEQAVVATTDAGVFAYYSRRTTINLDGLINNYRYRELLRAGRLPEYLRDREVTYILDQYLAGDPDWVAGTYQTRPYRVWFHPEGRVAGEVTLRRENEVARVQTESRLALGTAERQPNAVVLWRFEPDR